MSQVGIEETKELLIALDELALIVLKQIKDGVQVSDLLGVVTAVLGSDETKEALSKAVTGITLIPSEIKDLDLGEGIELIKTEIAYVPKFLEALKK